MNPIPLMPRRRLLARLAPLAPLLGACATVQPPVPPALDPPAGQARTHTVAARGVQIYECKTAAAGAAPAWTFVAPEADLFDAQGRHIGSHGAGPFWQAADGSRIVGRVKARADAPQAGAIPWLLLETSSNAGGGAFSAVRSVQRVNTRGGLAPNEPCTPAQAGRIARVDYGADYHFFAPR